MSDHWTKRGKTEASTSARRTALPPLEFHPLSSDRWPDFEKLFGARGACAGCWCMWWRLPAAQWRAGKGNANRRALQRIVRRGTAPGLLAYAARKPIGWCALAPRAAFPRLATSRILKPVDEQAVWSVTCFFVAREFRRRGVTVELLKAAVKFAQAHGAEIVEGYPVDAPRGQPDVFVYTGLVSAFRRAGFKEVARRSATRPIMRCVCKGEIEPRSP